MEAIFSLKKEWGKGKRWVTGEVVKENPKTVWVIAPRGKVIKRHKLKHEVELAE